MKKKEYTSPEIREWGTVADLTGVGNSRVGTDMFSGSVNPPGHSGGQGGGRGGGD